MIKHTVSFFSLFLTLFPLLSGPSFAASSDNPEIPLEDGHEVDVDLNADLDGEEVEDERDETADDAPIYDESNEVIVNEESLNRTGQEEGDFTPDENDN